MEISKQLQSKRKELKYTQDDLAEKIHVSRQTISNWENGRTLPDIESLILISDFYEISLDNLIKGDDKMAEKLSQDTKQGNEWFLISCLLHNSLYLLLMRSGIFKNHPKAELIFFLIMVIFTVFIAYRGWNYLKNEQTNYSTLIKESKSKFVVTENSVLYFITILLGVVAPIIGVLTLSI